MSKYTDTSTSYRVSCVVHGVLVVNGSALGHALGFVQQPNGGSLVRAGVLGEQQHVRGVQCLLHTLVLAVQVGGSLGDALEALVVGDAARNYTRVVCRHMGSSQTIVWIKMWLHYGRVVCLWGPWGIQACYAFQALA